MPNNQVLKSILEFPGN
jgi:hypothetical protein